MKSSIFSIAWLFLALPLSSLLAVASPEVDRPHQLSSKFRRADEKVLASRPKGKTLDTGAFLRTFPNTLWSHVPSCTRRSVRSSNRCW